ncbi:alpha/beta hydrolase [Christensenellaceae bacterium OttesenSCG-928-M15]|nr:alpha/beta hydrolase [Christensenellaceae bacterium OttesenSCG-928-M15]
MSVQVIHYPSATGVGEIHAEIFRPVGIPWAVVQIAHGMAEHTGRYQKFANYLCEKGVLVAMNDHAGHGKSFEELNHLGYFGHENGRTALIQDMKELHDQVVKEYPDIPYVLLGHSMGSFLARAYASFHTTELSACIFSGTAGKTRGVFLGRLVAKLEFIKNGPRKPSRLLHKLAFAGYNKRIKNARTENDWLSRDAAIVNTYNNDPLCGFYYTAEGMRDIFKVLSEISSPHWAKKVPAIPILMISGDADPVGRYGKGVLQVYKWLQKTRHTVTLLLYPGGRHEMLNETNRDEVYREVYAFLLKYFKMQADM